MRFFGLIAVLALSASVAAASAHTQLTRGHQPPADVAVTHWSEIAAAQLTPLPTARAIIGMAMVHGAIYDAVNAIDGGHRSYIDQPAAAATDSLDAAVAAAAYNVLLGLGVAPAVVDSPSASALLLVPDGPAKTGGVVAGAAAAASMLAARASDGRGG